MDDLTYAYLQSGRVADATVVDTALKPITGMSGTGFEIGYVGSAMPVLLAVETGDWATAAQLTPMLDSAPQVDAVVW